jgi:hypothetical protein
MNPLTKLIATATLLGSALAGAAAGSLSGTHGWTVNAVGVLSTQVAAQVQDHVVKTLALSRVVRMVRGASAVIDGNHMVVEASRLPPEGTFTALIGAAKSVLQR